MKSAPFNPSDLQLVASAPAPDMPALSLGDFCRLNSGGPKMLVVDFNEINVTASYVHSGKCIETLFDRRTVRRVWGE